MKLAGSEKVFKGQQQEQQRIQEQIISNNSLFSLAKYIGGLTKKDTKVSFHESKLTKALHGILQNEEKPCQVSFITHIYPVEQNYEECLLSLQYMDRLKAYDANYTKVVFDGPMPEQVQAQERLMQRVMDENNDLKNKFEQLQNDERDKFEEIKKKLGLEYNIPQLLRAKPNSKENSYVKLHVEAEERSHTLNKVNQGMNGKFKNMVRDQEQSTLQLQQFQLKCDKQIKMLEQKYQALQHSFS